MIGYGDDAPLMTAFRDIKGWCLFFKDLTLLRDGA